MRSFVSLLILVCALRLTADSTPAVAAATVWREARPLMGTLVDIQLEGQDEQALRRAADGAYREMQRLTDMMSHYDPNSAVSEINRQAGVTPVVVAPELIEVLQMARRVSEATGGAFDVTIGALSVWRFDANAPRAPTPAAIEAQRTLVNYRDVIIDELNKTVMLKRRGMQLDLGGIAKLYILDAGMRTLRRHGIASAMINGGGDVVVIGPHRAHPWRIGIRDPRDRRATRGVIELREGFVVSSGNYERYFEQGGRRFHHILDPHTGRPSQGLAHVTLAAPRLELVNGYGPAIMVLGYEGGRRLIERLPGIEAVLIRPRGTAWATPRLSHFLTPPPAP